jgi:hypothetical protein
LTDDLYTLLEVQRLHADVAPLSGMDPAPDGQLNLGGLLVIQRMAPGM